MGRTHLITAIMVGQLLLLIAGVVLFLATDLRVLAVILVVIALCMSVAGALMSRPSRTDAEWMPSSAQVAAYRREHPEATHGQAVDALRAQRTSAS